MNSRALTALLAAALIAPALRAAEPVRWSVGEEARIAAEAASWAPPDLKRQLAKHSKRLMQGVADAAAADRLAPRAPAHREGAARVARGLAEGIRRHEAFAEIAYRAGALVHAAAMAYAPDAAGAPGPSSFAGFTSDAFAAPESLVHAVLPSGTDAARRAAAVTLSARLLAWTWKTAGGDVSIVTQYPEAKGPYAP